MSSIIQKGLAIALLLSTFALNAQISVVIQVNQNISCHGGSDGSLTAIVSPAGLSYSYSWSNGGSTATITDLSAGAYVVTVQNAAGGSAIATGIITEPVVLALNALTELPLNVNPTGTVEVETTGGTEPYAFQWVNQANIPFSNEEDLIDAPAGIYTQTATDANGCTAVLTPVTLMMTSATDNVLGVTVRAFPNPVSKDLVLEIPEGENVQIQVFNAMGQLVETRMLQGLRTSISVENWPSGYYSLVSTGISKTVKVLVEKN
jgi:hypothetical protein